MTHTYAERDVAAALIDPAELARVDAVANAMATKRVELIHQPLSFIWRELAREAISVSGRHLQSEDTNVAEGEACQSGPEGATPNPNSLQEGALEEMIERLETSIADFEDEVELAWEREDRPDLWEHVVEVAIPDAKVITQSLRSLSTDLAKAKEERDEPMCWGDCGWMQLEAAQARAEALQAENASLKASNRRLRNELEEIRDWAVVERAPLRVQEIESINLALSQQDNKAKEDGR